MSHSQWNELDGFDLDFEKYGDKSVPISDLEDFRNLMKGKGVVRIYITLNKDPKVPETTAFIDYIKIGDEIISFEPLEEEDIKDGPKTATPGGVNGKIKFPNYGSGNSSDLLKTFAFCVSDWIDSEELG